MAKAHRLKFDLCKQPWRPNARLQQEHWSIHWKGQKMTEIDKDELYNLIFEQQANDYLLERSDLPVTALDKINWEAAAKAQTKWPLGKNFGWRNISPDYRLREELCFVEGNGSTVIAPDVGNTTKTRSTSFAVQVHRRLKAGRRLFLSSPKISRKTQILLFSEP